MGHKAWRGRDLGSGSALSQLGGALLACLVELLKDGARGRAAATKAALVGLARHKGGVEGGRLLRLGWRALGQVAWRHVGKPLAVGHTSGGKGVLLLLGGTLLGNAVLLVVWGRRGRVVMLLRFVDGEWWCLSYALLHSLLVQTFTTCHRTVWRSSSHSGGARSHLSCHGCLLFFAKGACGAAGRRGDLWGGGLKLVLGLALGLG